MKLLSFAPIKPLSLVKFYITCLLLFLSLIAYGQTWEQIKNSSDYLTGEGTGQTIAEGDANALSDLTQCIGRAISIQWNMKELEQNLDRFYDPKTAIVPIIRSYSIATMNNSEKMILTPEPNVTVGRYIRKSELEKLFEQRRRKISEYIDGAERALERGKVDVALRMYYWAYSLTRSLPYPNKEKYNGNTLTSWIINQMNEVLSDLSVYALSCSDNYADFAFMYKGKPVNSLDFTYYDCGWSNICSALDGRGNMFWDPSENNDSLMIRIEYKYENQASLDQDVLNVIRLFKPIQLSKALVEVSIAASELNETELDITNPNNTFTDVLTKYYKPIKQMDEPNAAPYLSFIKKIEQAIRLKQYKDVKGYFTHEGWTKFENIILHGNVRLFSAPHYSFTQLDDNVFVRGMRINLSFPRSACSNFMEDVVFTINSDCKIDNVTLGLGKTTENDILARGVWPERSRLVLMNILENYKTAYALKCLDYLRSIFWEKALIVMGNKRNESAQYSEKSKEDIIKRLEQGLNGKEFVNLRINDINVMKMSRGGESYGIEISQDIYSTTFGDHAFLFFLVDVNDSRHPLIRVCTWQDERDPQFGVYSADDFPIR